MNRPVKTATRYPITVFNKFEMKATVKTLSISSNLAKPLPLKSGDTTKRLIEASGESLKVIDA